MLQLRDIAALLATADPKDKAEVYRELGVQVHCDPHRRIVSVSAGARATGGILEETQHSLYLVPGTRVSRVESLLAVGGPTSTICDWRLARWPS